MTTMLIVDMLARGPGKRLSTLDTIGAGPRAVAGVLEMHGVNVELVPGENMLYGKVRLDTYDALLVSGMTSDVPGVKKVVLKWRKKTGGKPVVAGGPMWNNYEELLESGVNVVVIGEAEATLEELLLKAGLKDGVLDTEALREIKGLAYRDGKGVHMTGRRPFLKARDLDRYMPSTKIVRCYPKYWGLRVYVEVVRGCSNVRIPEIANKLEPPLKPKRLYPGCAYCSVVSTWGPSRSISMDRVVNEIKKLIEEGVRRIVLSAPDFLDYYREENAGTPCCINPRNPPPNTRRIRELLSRLYMIPEIACGEVTLMVENVKPSLVNEEVAEILGFYLSGTPIHLGVESGDNELLKLMGRPSTVEEGLRAVELLSKNGLRPYVYLMYGLPYQGEESVEKTLRLIPRLVKAGAEKITLYRFTPLPGTLLENSPPGDPNEPHNRRLLDEVRKWNTLLKDRFVGRILQVIVTDELDKYYVGYPVKHGPVTLIRKEPRGRRRDIVGRRVKVLIERALSDRKLVGRIVKVGRRVAS